MKALKCENVNPSIYNTTIYCRLKATRDGTGRTTMLYIFGKPANDIQFQLKSYFKYGNVFQPWIIRANIDFCGSWNEEDLSTFLRLMSVNINKHMPGMLHRCPYFGEEGFRNISLDKIISTMFQQILPKGEYKILVRLHLKDNRTISNVYLTFLLDATEPLKSFEMGKR